MPNNAKNKKNPSLFGLKNSNKDFTDKSNWGKNQFNNCFPAALACYMYVSKIEPIYLKLDNKLDITHEKISVKDVYGIEPNSSDIFFAFEGDYTPYRKLVIGNLPRADLVIQNRENACLNSLEIKLTALPDNSTYNLDDSRYGCEIVVRPDTIVYLALSIMQSYMDSRKEILNIMKPVCKGVRDWTSIKEILPIVQNLSSAIDEISLLHLANQKPLVMQPVWKTKGKSLQLENDCLDIFIWSDLSFARLFIDVTKKLANSEDIKRPMRSSVWLSKMLYDFAESGRFNHRKIIDEMTYNTKNDKAFAVNGRITCPYMASDELKKPRIKRNEIRNIILGNGEKYLSPERRFDAAILSASELFD